VAAWFGVFAVYAGAVAAFTGHEDRAWAVFAFGCYALAAILLRFGKNWWPGLTVAITGALIAPFAWLATQEQDTAEVKVIGRAAGHVLKYGTPYLPISQLQDWRSYNPYLPVMEVFGLPRSAGLGGIAGDPRVWTSLATLTLLAIAFAIMAPHRLRGCASCRERVIQVTVIAMASPVIAFPLALGITDPPVIALICVALACVSRGWIGRASLAVAIACAMKYTAWPVLPVFAVMLWVRYQAKAAAGFVGTTVGTAAFLALLAAPDAMAQPDSLVQNTVAFPLGLTHHKTPAASPLPGHLLSELGPAGHLAAVALMGVAAVAFAAWLLLRPPKTHQSVAWRLAVGYAAMFVLAPATRFGYFAYPLCLLGWLVLTNYESRIHAQRSLAAVPARLTRWRGSRGLPDQRGERSEPSSSLAAQAPGGQVLALGRGQGVDLGA
jgi:phosphatidylinositol alpha-1,6-mannosyltransferase